MDSIIHRGPVDRGRAAVITLRGRTSWGELLDLAEAFSEQVAVLAGGKVGAVVIASAAGFALLAALERRGCEAFLLAEQLTAEERSRLADRFDLIAICEASPEGNLTVTRHGASASRVDNAAVTILTSGTSGVPKAVRHTWGQLARPVRRTDALHQTTWLLCYPPALYAGLQVVLQCLANGGTLAVPPTSGSAAEVAQLARAAGVQYASGTPSYWRWLLTFVPADDLRRVPLVQITLGGEVVDQRILDQLHAVFPQARLVHIYATTELGRCFSVTDGHEGFPRRFLEQVSADGVEMRIDEGELVVRSANAMVGYSGPAPAGVMEAGWIHTGDIVECRDNRCYFVGRQSDLINVGGNKVSPLRVEQLLATIPGVSDVRVFAKRSSLVGQLVACEFVPDGAAEAGDVKRAIQQWANDNLPAHERPRIIKAVQQIEFSSAGKRLRSE